MRRLLEIALTGLVSLRLHPLRSLVSFLAVVVVLLPFLVGMALAQGLEADAETSARLGADLYVKGSQFGRPVPVPLKAVDGGLPEFGASSAGLLGSPFGQGPLLAASALFPGRTVDAILRIDGVTKVVPRIVGEVVLGKEDIHAVLVGLPPEHFPDLGVDSVQGKLPFRGQRPGPHELVLGTTLARRLGVKLGKPERETIPPFYHNNRRGDRLSRVVGIFAADAPSWQSNLILTTFDSAAAIFDQEGLATDLLIWCRRGYEDSVSRTIARDLSFPSPVGEGIVRLRVTAREDLLALLPRSLLHREGIFTLHFVLAFVVGILVLLVTSGVGLAERRREVGILKATGWQTDEILLRHLAESLALSLSAACVSLLLAWAWLRLFGGYGIASFFLAGAGTSPDFVVPFRLTPIPALLGFVLSLVIVLSGTLYSAWRAAAVPPREAMR